MTRHLAAVGERILGRVLPEVKASAAECSSGCGCQGNIRWLKTTCCNQSGCWTSFCGYSSSCA